MRDAVSSVVGRAARAFLARRPPSKRFYLVSPAGVPNFGDEFIARSWLDWLAQRHPDADVWLDCIEPGRAAHLFADTHPRLRVTNTLWQLAHVQPAGDLEEDALRARGYVRDLGTPRLDLGLEAMRDMTSIHLLGGGYMNSLWPLNLTILAALAEVASTHGVRVYATGQGLLPQTSATTSLVARCFEEFAFVEARDAAGALHFGVDHGTDDAFLAFANSRPVFAEFDTPDVMVLAQGDFIDPETQTALTRRIRRFVDRHSTAGGVGLVEGLPPDDSRFWSSISDSVPGTVQFPFMRMWQEGFPARPGQTWLTTRFHFHLLAAAAGAAGASISLDNGFYDVKHGLLREAGTGWADVTIEDDGAAESAEEFSTVVVPRLARAKSAVAERLYG